MARSSVPGKGKWRGARSAAGSSTTTTTKLPDHPTETPTVLFRLPEAELGPVVGASGPLPSLPSAHSPARTTSLRREDRHRRASLPQSTSGGGITLPCSAAG